MTKTNNEETEALDAKLAKLGAFEITQAMIDFAKKNKKKLQLLNAGRGNPNWINTQSRLAFCRLMKWGIYASEQKYCKDHFADVPNDTNIYECCVNYLKEHNDETSQFLLDCFSYCLDELKLDGNELVAELTHGILGDNYPSPSRCLTNIEKIVNKYLAEMLYRGNDLSNETQIFATEGATAAISYLFKSLKHNGILNPGDKIAINTPIFTPYLQIPKISTYDLVEIEMQSTPTNNWQFGPEELEKLRDPKIKVACFVNPSNPESFMLDQASLDRLVKIMEERTDLILVTDDVYGSFVANFRSIYSLLPYNTVLVYSYSKLYGVTGWRTGLIAMNKSNVVDELISQLGPNIKEKLDKDYSIVSTDPRNLPFIERVCADSRDIGLYHTSGLSTPQQVLMALMSLTHLVAKADDKYLAEVLSVIDARYQDLWDGLGLKGDNSVYNTKYYCLIDIYQVAEAIYGAEFSNWLKGHLNKLDFLYRLAEEDGVVLMPGRGFDAQPGTIRVSQANLPDKAYYSIGRHLVGLLGEFYQQYLNA